MTITLSFLFVKRKTLSAIMLLVTGLAAATIYIAMSCKGNACLLFSLSALRRVTDFASCVENGFAVNETTPQQCLAGMRVFWEDDAANVHVLTPLAHQDIGLPIRYAGSVRAASGGTLHVRLLDWDRFLLLDVASSLQPALSGAWLSFEGQAVYPAPLGTGGTLEVSLEGRDRKHSSIVSVPVRFRHVDAREVKVYFGNRERDPNRNACDIAYPVARRIPLVDEPMRGALEQLLLGPTVSDVSQNFVTAIPDGTVLQSLQERNGILVADFSKSLLSGSGSMCDSQAIRAQIEDTLWQFSDVRKILITVNGDDIETRASSSASSHASSVQ